MGLELKIPNDCKKQSHFICIIGSSASFPQVVGSLLPHGSKTTVMHDSLQSMSSQVLKEIIHREQVGIKTWTGIDLPFRGLLFLPWVAESPRCSLLLGCPPFLLPPPDPALLVLLLFFFFPFSQLKARLMEPVLRFLLTLASLSTLARMSGASPNSGPPKFVSDIPRNP